MRRHPAMTEAYRILPMMKWTDQFLNLGFCFHTFLESVNIFGSFLHYFPLVDVLVIKRKTLLASF